MERDDYGGYAPLIYTERHGAHPRTTFLSDRVLKILPLIFGTVTAVYEDCPLRSHCERYRAMFSERLSCP